MSDGSPVVELLGIRKSFGDLVVNDGVDLALVTGEVHALLGENGAGKTTLMRILYGLTRPDAGTIRIAGSPVEISSPRVAIASGIGMVTQHFSLVSTMTVTENLVLSSVGLGPVDLEAARAQVRATADRLGVPIDPDAKVGSLSIGEQQRVEILKALSHECRVLIMDEPTAVLVPQDVELLFATIRRLTDEGLGVLFISHKLHEVTAISHRVSVLRRGRIVDTVAAAGIEPRELATLMVGTPTVGVTRADRGSFVGSQNAEPGPASLEINDLTVARRGARPALDSISLVVRPGEIVGLAGVSGNGQRPLVDVLSGMTRPTSGSVRVRGTDVTGATPHAILAAGLGRIPEDRHGSIVADLSVEQNLVLEDIEAFRRGPFLDRRRIRAHARDVIERFDIKAAPGDPVGALSGGNMQKVLLARVLVRDPTAIVVAQPTRGLDVGAAGYVHRQLLERRRLGAGILLVSEDLEELLALADRLLVIFDGRIVGGLPTAEATPERLGLLMSGEAA